MCLNSLHAKEIFVAPLGNDQGAGTRESPYATFEKALEETKKYAGQEAVNVWFFEGTYYLERTLLIGAEYSGTAAYPVVFSALPGARVSIKGSRLMNQLEWKEYKDGIFVTEIPHGLIFDQLFINGDRQVRARFPNYDYQNPIRGGNGYHQVTGGSNRRYDTWFSYNPEIFSEREWKNPETGIVHAFQSHNWGNMQYRIKGIDRTENKIILAEGGWQLQRSHGIGGGAKKSSWFFIENIQEELDVAGEWFLDTTANLLYYYPVPGVKLDVAKVEVPVLKDLVQFRGSKESPISHVHIKGFHFTQSTLTFMEEYEPVARGDWAIHRGGAVFLEGAENCVIEDCSFETLGGNGVFMSAYNRNNQVRNCLFVHTGESAVCLVGSPSAVRFYQTWDDRHIDGKDWEEMRQDMDMEPGPLSPDYPKNCVVENCIMHDFGDFGKQVAGVYISMSHQIRVSYTTIYNCPRAGICINDGTWGGHIIEHCDIWETVRETGEHGPFNSWGRERQWKGGGGSNAEFIKDLTKLDAIDVTVLRNNRIANYRKSISAGNWTIDLDDGSSYYDIYNNLNLGSTIKLRDGMTRRVYNNITVSAVPLGWHVWPEESEDEIYQNIFVISGAVPGTGQPTKQFVRPIKLPANTKWSEHYDRNLYWNINFPDTPMIHGNLTLDEWQDQEYDLESVIADPLFVDPANGDYSVRENSPALELGFENFPMNAFGHYMTRMLPLGGEFQDEIRVILRADSRINKDGSLRYTLDGSEPGMNSLKYSEALKLKNSTTLKCRSFDANGIPLGFTCEAQFKKVSILEYPSWLGTLLEGKYTGSATETQGKALETEVMGALLVNIADDPDLIDASGGYNSGCLIKSLDPDKAKLWLDSGLENSWIIQKINEDEIQNISELKSFLKRYSGKKATITAVRNYTSKTFKITLPGK